jgi:hypothetical protein
VKPAGAADFGAPRDLTIAEASRPAAVVAADGTVTVAWQQGGGCMGSSAPLRAGLAASTRAALRPT